MLPVPNKDAKHSGWGAKVKYAPHAAKWRAPHYSQGIAVYLPMGVPLWNNESKEHEVDARVIDSDGYRPNVGIILSNDEGRLLWARRIGQDAWQFPQGGIRENETPEEALFRELMEEVGLTTEHVRIIACTKKWLRYQLPQRYIRRHTHPICIGQKQIWYMLRMIGSDTDVRLDHSDRPEFDSWRWVDYWYPLRKVVAFKRGVYERALYEFAPLVFPDSESSSAGPSRPRQYRRR